MILLRHGQSEFNVIYGRTRVDPGIEDPPLTALGRRQAIAAAEVLRRHGIRRLISSPYTRALETAGEIAGVLGLPVTVDPMVRERRAFSCDIGTVRSRLGQKWPHLDLANLDERWWPEEPETEAAVARRGGAFAARMREARDWAQVAVITHWGLVFALTGQRLGNCEAVRLEHDEAGGATVVASAVHP